MCRPNSDLTQIEMQWSQNADSDVNVTVKRVGIVDSSVDHSR